MRALQELIICCGFLGGLWIYAGVNPETEILKAFTDLVPGVSSVLFWAGSIVLTVAPVWSTWRIGGVCGLVALLLAFLGGIFIESIGIWLLIIALVIGGLCPPRRKQGL